MKVLQGSLWGWTGVTLREILGHFGGTFKTILGVVLGPFEGTLGALWVVPWIHFGDTLEVTLEVLWDYF